MKAWTYLLVICFSAPSAAANEIQRLRGLAHTAASASSIITAPEKNKTLTRFSNWTDEQLAERIMKTGHGDRRLDLASVQDELDDVTGRLGELEAPDFHGMIGELTGSIDALRTMYKCLRAKKNCKWTDWLDQVTIFFDGLAPWIVILFPVGGVVPAAGIKIARSIARVIIAVSLGDSETDKISSEAILDRIDEKIEISASKIQEIFIEMKTGFRDKTWVIYLEQLRVQMIRLDSPMDPAERQELLEFTEELLWRHEPDYNLLAQSAIDNAYNQLFGTHLSIRRKDFAMKSPFDRDCNTDDKCGNGAAQHIIKKRYDKARACYNDMLHVKGLLDDFREEAVTKYRKYVETYMTRLLLSSAIMTEVFGQSPKLHDKFRLTDKHDVWRKNAGNIIEKLRTAQVELSKCGLVVSGFKTNSSINETQLEEWKDNAFAQVCNSDARGDGFCNFNNFLGRCENERVPDTEVLITEVAVELRRNGKNEVGACEYFVDQYGASNGFGQNLFKANKATKVVARDCYDMFRGKRWGWWRCLTEQSYPYALPNVCAPADCVNIFGDEQWWSNKEKSSFP